MAPSGCRTASRASAPRRQPASPQPGAVPGAADGGARPGALMTEVDTLDAVGQALDRVAKLGFTISSTLGRHTNDKMISFYVRAPGGWDLEFGTEGMLVDETSTPPRRSRRTATGVTRVGLGAAEGVHPEGLITR
ncbi:hypothetical protein GTA09_30910 [Rhodococcus hoagii]|nr:hypothetical protein [Prescottella equi]